MIDLDHAKAKRIIELAAKGLFRINIAAVICILEETIEEWEKRGKKAFVDDMHGLDVSEEDYPYLSFYRDLRQAEGQVEENLVEAWQTAGISDWKACEKLLAVRFPDRWNPKNRIELDASVKGKVSHDLSKLSKEELATMLDLMDKSEASDD